MQTLNAILLCHNLLLPKVREAHCLVDATTGNGKDTVFLAQNSAADSMVYAFDIQEQAIVAASKHIKDHELAHKVQFICDNHKNVGQYIEQPIDVAMFNLGYLPGEQHEIRTTAQTTMLALVAVISRLAVGGIISIVAYPGHEGGREENNSIREYIRELPSKQFTVVAIDMLNHRKNPPILYVIEKTSLK